MNTLDTVNLVAPAPTMTTVATPVTDMLDAMATPTAADALSTVATPSVSKPRAIKSLFRAVKRSPVKALVITAGVAGAMVGAVYLVKEVRKARSIMVEADKNFSELGV